jgi:hypothetical protein
MNDSSYLIPKVRFKQIEVSNNQVIEISIAQLKQPLTSCWSLQPVYSNS